MKADCSYLSVLGMRIHTTYLRVKVTKDGESSISRVVLKSRGTRDGSLSLAKLRKMVEDGYTVGVCVAGADPLHPGEHVYLTDWLPFDPSASRGRSGLFRRKDTAPEEVSTGKRATVTKGGEKALATILLDGISYGTGEGVASGNAHQVQTILKLTGGADALAERLAVFTLRAAGGGDAEAGHAARMAFRGLLDYYESANPPWPWSTVLRAYPSVAAAVCLLPENFAALLQVEHSGVDPQIAKDLIADAVSTFVSYDEYTSADGGYEYERRETRLFDTSPLGMQLFEQMARGEFTVDRLFDKSSRRMPHVEHLRENLCFAAAVHVTDPAVLGELAQGSSMEGVRRVAAARLTDQTLLGTLALKDTSESVRITAIGRLTDQKVLADLVLKDEPIQIREAAIANLTDQTLLATVATTTTSGRHPYRSLCVRVTAIERLTDQKVLADLVLKDESIQIREAALTRVTDQKVLAEAALKDASEHVRITAIGRLNDQKVLAEVALGSVPEGFRLVAVRRLTDQKVLAEVALKDASEYVRVSAVERLTDQKVLADLVLKDESIQIREAAIANLTDQTLLATVALSCESADYRSLAIEKLTDEAVLLEVVTKEHMDLLRHAAAKKIANQEMLAELAVGSDSDTVRIAAVEKLTDQAALLRVALTDASDGVRIAAVEKLTDQAALLRVALTDASDGVRIAAVKRMTQAKLVELVVNAAPGGLAAASESVRLAVVNRLSNETALAELALKEESASVRAAVYVRLSRDKEHAVRDMRKKLGLPK